jgi:hypothetical protein
MLRFSAPQFKSDQPTLHSHALKQYLNIPYKYYIISMPSSLSFFLRCLENAWIQESQHSPAIIARRTCMYVRTLQLELCYGDTS